MSKPLYDSLPHDLRDEVRAFKTLDSAGLLTQAQARSIRARLVRRIETAMVDDIKSAAAEILSGEIPEDKDKPQAGA